MHIKIGNFETLYKARKINAFKKLTLLKTQLIIIISHEYNSWAAGLHLIMHRTIGLTRNTGPLSPNPSQGSVSPMVR